MHLKTEHLILRPWQSEDAADLYAYAQNPKIGFGAGFPAHTSLDSSKDVLKNILCKEETYAICLKETNRPIGSIGLMFGKRSHFELKTDEAELGYWIGEPFWGQGLTAEACQALLRHGFEDLGLNLVWCYAFEDNKRSQRLQKKLGFRFHHHDPGQFSAHTNAIRPEIATILTKEDWSASFGQDRKI